MVLTFDTHVADCLVDVLNEGKEDDSKSGSATRLRVRKPRSRVVEPIHLHFKQLHMSATSRYIAKQRKEGLDFS